ncbi:MAG: ABC transporter substrate-binding protein [Holosporaceae bacterium]|nr:ABC transporter substrate-binding protein [Holosporaceae bacterium]
MKKCSGVWAAAVLLLLGCSDEAKKPGDAADDLRFAVCADYPPFEYYKAGHLVGLDVELAKLLAKKLGKTASFADMPLGAMLASIQNETVDAALSAIEITEERKAHCDFSNVYCNSGCAIVYKKNTPITRLEQVTSGKIAYQCGSSDHQKMLEEKAPTASLTAVDTVNVAIEMLKAGHVDYVFLDVVPARTFCEKNEGLAYSSVAENSGYVLMFKQGSALRAKVNEALKELESSGELQMLKDKYLR